MPRGSKAKYTEKQKDKAESIERSYERKGIPQSEAEARAWATVNKQSGGGNRSGGSGQKKSEQANAQSRSSSAKRAAASRQDVPRADSLERDSKDELMKKAVHAIFPGVQPCASRS
tara:strand:- start:393 stop:740 length:348 start_codon:yes stop_codon:yes gene_type:complete